MHNIFKSTLILLSLLCIPLSLCETANTIVPAPTYNIHCNPNIHAQIEIHPQIELHPQIYIANSSAFSVKVGDITLQCIQKIKETVTPEHYHSLKNCIKNIMWEYRYHITGATIVGSYSIISALLLNDYYHMLGSNTWAHWKQNCSFEDLCTIPQKDLTHELLCTINERYYNADKPTDFAHPLMTFITTIDTEIKTCKSYLALANTIKKLRLIKIFPTNDAKINEITKLLERTLFIKHLFLSWLAEYNINNPNIH